MYVPSEPTGDQCEAEAKVADLEGGAAFACWYPQMGGYVGKCVVVVDGPGCFDAYVWHDGDFPFGDREPARLHHCDPEQFEDFAKTVRQMQAQTGGVSRG